MAVADYDLRAAARRMGITYEAARLQLGKRLVAIPGSDPVRVRATQVDEHRARALDKFSDVLDLTGIVNLAAIPTSEWETALTAARELFEGGVDSVTQAHRMLRGVIEAGLNR
ncbi:MAG TPA: hypothetical protein VF230_00420 [Acidimicrobiales bacterium]